MILGQVLQAIMHMQAYTVNARRTLINVDAVWAYSLDQGFLSKSLIERVSSNCINVNRTLIEGGNTQQVFIIYVMQEMG